ncbi:MAG TPA: c-type cytochrome domain-containing protein [Gemmataceae bacterium]|nr:c-type cytochrome domain-containing protein [Gemmataceae bacterium]
MTRAVPGRWLLLVAGCLLGSGSLRAADTELAAKAVGVLTVNCHRCHGQDGAAEGGMNFILDPAKLVARKKIVPGQPDQSPLFKKLSTGKMPPPGETPRPSEADVAVVKQWIEAGALPPTPVAQRPITTDADVFKRILADLDRQDRHSRRFLRYLSLAPIADAGAGEDELQTYRNAVAKLINSLSWSPRITLPTPIDADRLVLRIDLRDYQWDANLWNRLLAEYPYGVLNDNAAARAVVIGTATRVPCVRADWFLASASLAPLYYDLLQIPSNLSELERQLRVDVATDVQQERVARAGFLGSGISRNNRLIERHDAMNGAYWRTYDFEAIPQNLVDRDLLLPDRRNLFAYPLGPGLADGNAFQHAAGEAIFNLPNGLQGYCLVNGNDVRQNKGNTAIVSDPKRPDRAVDAGVSCMSCHARGINPKDDQIRDHVAKNPKFFKRTDAETIRALYVPKEKMRALMEEDSERFRKALEKTGNKVSPFEPVMNATLRYEADVDLPTLAAEIGLKPEELQARIVNSQVLSRSFGPLKAPGGTVPRQVVAQAFGDLVRDLRMGSVFQPGQTGEVLRDNTGEVDPLEAQSSPANAVAFSPDGRWAAFASADKSVVIWGVAENRELRRCIGHTASVWCVAFSPDGSRLLSGGKDGTVRLWETRTAREIRQFEGHEDLVTCVAFGPNGRWAISAGYDERVIRWDLETATADANFTLDAPVKYINAVAISPDGSRCLVCAENNVCVADAKTGKVLTTYVGHADSVTAAVFSADGRRILSGGDDRTLRLWEADSGKTIQVFRGCEGGIKSLAFSPDGGRVLSGSADATVRLWDVESGKDLRDFRKHAESVVDVAFLDEGRATLSASRDADVRIWRLEKAPSPTLNPDYPPVVAQANPSAQPSDGRGGVTPPLHPTAIIPIGGTVGALHMSLNRKWLYALNVTDGKLVKIDAVADRRYGELRLGAGVEALAISPDGKTLAAMAPVDGINKGATACELQIIDPVKLELRKDFTVAAAPYDIALSDAGLAFLSGGDGDWTDVSVVDADKEAIVARWGGVWNRSFLRLSADQKRLYVSSQGVKPGTLDALPLPDRLADRPAAYRAAPPPQDPLDGEVVATPDGRFLLCKTGVVLTASENREEDMQFAAWVGPFTAAAVDPDAGSAFFLTREGVLKHYSYPEFKPLAVYDLGIVATQAALDGKAGKLYVAGFDPKAAADHPRARGFGDVFVYSLQDVLTKK